MDKKYTICDDHCEHIELPEEEAFGVEEWPEITYDDPDVLVDEYMDIKEAHEELEKHESMVECQECMELFPKEECVKMEYGYVCPACHKLIVKEVEFPKELIDEVPFELEFPAPVDFSEEDEGDPEFAAIPDETVAAAVEEPVSGDSDFGPESAVTIAVDPANPEDVSVISPVDVAAETPVETVGVTPEEPLVSEIAPEIPFVAEFHDDGSSDDSEDSSDEVFPLNEDLNPDTHLGSLEKYLKDAEDVLAHAKEINAGEDVYKAMEKKIDNCKKDIEDYKKWLEKKPESKTEITEEASITEEVIDEGLFDDKKLDKIYKDDGGYYTLDRDYHGNEVKKTDFATFKDAEAHAKAYSKIEGNGMSSICGKKDNWVLRTYDDGKVYTDHVSDTLKGEKNAAKVMKKELKDQAALKQADAKATGNAVYVDAAAEASSTKTEEPGETPADSVEEPAKAAPANAKLNSQRANNKKIVKAMNELGLDISKLVVKAKDKNGRDYTKASPELNKLRKLIFNESYADIPFDSDVKEGDKIRIIHLEGEGSEYDGKEGTVDHIDSIGQLHGTWGGLAVIPGVDAFEIISEELKEDIDFRGSIDLDIINTGAESYGGGPYYDADRIIVLFKDTKDNTYWALTWCETESSQGPLSDSEEIIADDCKSLEELITTLKKDGWLPEKYALTEASSAEKKAFKYGGKDYADYITGKAIARIKDKEMQKAAIALAKADASKDALDRFTGDRKVDQAERDFEKKASKMELAGVTEDIKPEDVDAAVNKFVGSLSEDLHKDADALIAEWARQDWEVGQTLDPDKYYEFEKICKDDGIEPSEKLFDHYFHCLDDLRAAELGESLEDTVDQDLADNRTPAPAEEPELSEPLDGTEVREHEAGIKKDNLEEYWWEDNDPMNKVDDVDDSSDSEDEEITQGEVEKALDDFAKNLEQ